MSAASSTLQREGYLLSLARELRRRVPWEPKWEAQQLAYESGADVVGYGGAAGGGKTDLMIGLALTHHVRSLVLRREGTQLTSIVDRVEDILGSRVGLNASPPPSWRIPGTRKLIEFGSCPNLGDENKHRGRPHDLLAFDEADQFLEAQVRFLMTWCRTTIVGQRTLTLMTFNPPASAEGQWIKVFFAPWLQKNHPRPAQPGELRWFAMLNGVETEVASSAPFLHNGEDIVPQSRTFIPSKVRDNIYLYRTGYMSQLQALPEPLRSQMLHGDFDAGMSDDAMQTIPTAWVEVAQARWVKPGKLPPMDSLGCDVARGGADNTIIARRHGMWFDELQTHPGITTTDGPKVAGLVVAALRDDAPCHIDIIGVGASPYDFLVQLHLPVIGVNVAEKSDATDRSGRLSFANLRSQLWWKMREALDPMANTGIALPPDPRLKADLTAPRWKLTGSKIMVESREDIVKRIGRSPDWASAAILALIDTPKLPTLRALGVHNSAQREHDPYANL